jgi:hypothetical protein
MRVPMAFVGVVLLSCSGGDDDGGTRLDPEICDDGIDNNGDGLVDCEDTTSCGGLVCRDPGDDDDDTAEPTPDVEVLRNDCCDFTFTCPAANVSVGQFSLINHSLENDAEFAVVCAPIGGTSPLAFQVVGSSAAPSASLRGVDLFADSTVSVEAFFACKPQLQQGFDAVCTVTAETDDDEWVTDIPVAADRD